jgi:ankyrin repeat protein
MSQTTAASWIKFLLVVIGALAMIALAFKTLTGGVGSLRLPRPALSPAQIALLNAARIGDLAGVRNSLGQGADVDSRERARRRTPLMFASTFNRTEIARLLLAAHADPGATDSSRWTPLCFAAEGDATGVAALLLESGARATLDTDCVDRSRLRTPLSIAINRGHAAIAALLLTAHADVRRADPTDLAPLDEAVHAGRVDLATLLLHAGAPPIISPGAHTASLLHLALEYCHDNDPEMVKLLVAAGTDTTTRDALGNTPLQSARTAGLRHLSEGCFGRIADALREAGVSK